MKLGNMLVRFLGLGVLALAPVLLTGCFESDDSSTKVASVSADSSGGSVTVPSGSPISGTVVNVAAGALAAGETVNIAINYSDVLPVGIDTTNVQSASKVILLTKDSGSQFLVPVTVTAPYDPLVAGSVPTVLYLDESVTPNIYRSIAVQAFDPVAKLVTFETVHFSKYAVFGPVTSRAALETGKIEVCKDVAVNCFGAATDGFFHPNFGSYSTPGGSAFGMAAYAIWYYDTKITTTSVASDLLYNKYRQGILASANDDVNVRELISRIYGATSKAWAVWASASDADIASKWKMTQDQVAKQLINALKITNSPQILLLRGVQAGGATSHAVVVYKYDGTISPKKFYIYDPNSPGEVVTLQYDPAAADPDQVLKSYSKLGATFSTISKYAFGSISSGIDPKRFLSLYDGVEAGWSAGTGYASISVTAPTADSQGKYVFTALANTDTSVTNAQLTGTISPATGQSIPQYLFVTLDGSVASLSGVTGGIVPVGSGGSFTLTFPTLSVGNHNLQLFATDSASAARRFDGFGGFKEVTLKVTTPAGTQFFQNAGFETGDTRGWTVETHTWGNRNPGSFGTLTTVADASGTYSMTTTGTSKSVISIPEPDEIATAAHAVNQSNALTILKALRGNYSLRVNNYDGSNHISTASQTVTVPSSGAPEIRFNWAAVLEDPQHDPGGQPYVIITVCDLDDPAMDCSSTLPSVTVTTAQGSFSYDPPNALYFKRYITNDPSYSGWLDYSGGSWKAIDWQTVIIPVASRAGHRIRIIVEAADCAYGGHGGYAYIDGDE